MQNTIVKEFMDNPSVVTAPMNQAESRSWVETFWTNCYLRGGLIWDQAGNIGGNAYSQPNVGIPFGRGFIIDQEGRVALPYFGHQPDMVIETIYNLLGTSDVQPSERSPAILLTGNPNPFRRKTRIDFALNHPGEVSLAVYDLSGSCIRTLANGWRDAGVYTLMWNGETRHGEAAGTGIYFLHLEADGQVNVAKILRLGSGSH
jgi:hypothetical protein